MNPSGSFEADQASGQSSQTEDNIGMEPIYYNAAAKIEIEDIPKPLNLTSPIKISEDSKSESGEPAQAEVNIGMKADYYNGAENGEIEVFKDIPEPLDQLLTPNRNTVLHIYLTSLKESESEDSEYLKPEDSESPTAFVKEILRMCPSLFWKANVKGETPLHIAARYGHADTVDVLIGHAKALRQDLESGFDKTVKEMLEMRNNEKDTALHEAVRGNHLEVVKRLIEEGPDFSYSQNDGGETPLYIAIERNFKEVALHILGTCKSLAHNGPLGRTTLHAAVIWDENDVFKTLMRRIAPQERSAFIKQADKQRSTPLHCAAYFNCFTKAQMLLQVDRSIAYMKDAKGKTALHIAAHRGYDKVMEDILYYCPDCCELVDDRGWNALHFAVNSSSQWAEDAVKFILNKPSLSNLLNENDASGNTPLHHHSKSLLYMKDIMRHRRVDKMAFNKQNLDAYDIALTCGELSVDKFEDIGRAFKENRPEEFRRFFLADLKLNLAIKTNHKYKVSSDRKKEFLKIMKEASEVHLIVDTLIATVTFAAGITMPGGFIGQEGPQPGSAVLTRNAAFRVFVITDAMAMVQSCCAAFIYLFMPLLFHEQPLEGFTFLLALLAFCLTILAMGATVLAFVAGTYAVLMHSSDLAVATCVIGLCFFIPGLFISIGCSNYLGQIWRMSVYLIYKKWGLFWNSLRGKA